jgi:saccharopine dehydrogenase-like NADP-dependent oxidoreductase
MGMKALVIGAGGVGRAIANIASRRKFISSMVIADRTLARAEEAVVRLKDSLLRKLMPQSWKIFAT